MLAINYKDNPSIYSDFESLTKLSFSVWESGPASRLIKCVKKNPNMDLICYYEEQQLIGYSLSYFFGDYAELYLLAVNPHIRNKGYGSEIMTFLKKKYEDKIFFLLYEVVDSKAKDFEIRKKRANFYEKNGFLKTNLCVKEFFGKYIVATNKENALISVDQCREGIYPLWNKFICRLLIKKIKK